VAAAALVVLALAATADAVTALTGRQRLRSVIEEQPGHVSTAQSVLDARRALAAALLLVQAIALVVMASLLTLVLRRELAWHPGLVSIVAVVVAYLLFGRALPRALAAGNLGPVSGFSVWIAPLLTRLVSPLTRLVDLVARGFAALVPGPAPEELPVGTEAELRAAVAPEDDLIQRDESRMIDGIMRLEETPVRDIMVPRIDIVAVAQSTPIHELVAIITRAGHSRIPVYDENIDHIVGILYAKDLLPFLNGSLEGIELDKLLRPVYWVPESKRVDELLKELRRSKVHIAIVVDEYGGTAGLVTIEDILEEIVGEIQDEYDIEEPLLVVVSETELVADGRLPLAEAGEALHVNFGEDEDYATLGGFVQKQLGRLPREGDEFDAAGVHVAVLSVERHRVRKLRLTRINEVAQVNVDAAAERMAAESNSGNGSGHGE